MKKLLIGTALVSTVLFAGSSFAETIVSGSLETTIGMTESKSSGVAANADPMSIGHETSIDLSTSKKLTNGLTMTAGFGVENGLTTDQYLSLTTTGGTMFAVGNDVDGVADNVSQEDFTPHIAQPWHDAGLKSGSIAGVYSVHGNNGIYLKHTTPMFTVAGVYSPSTSNTDATGASDNAARGAATTVAVTNLASGYDLAISGGFGVEGLKIGYGVSNAKAVKDSGTSDQEGRTYGAQYSMGGATVGYGKTINTAAGSTVDKSITTYGVAYKVSDVLSVGVYEGKVDVDAIASDEKYRSLQIGYDFGGLGMTLGYYTADSIGGVSGTDNEKIELRTVTKF